MCSREESFETREVGGDCQSQPVGERLSRVAGRRYQLGNGYHALTLQRPAVTVKLTSTPLAHERFKKPQDVNPAWPPVHVRDAACQYVPCMLLS